LTAEVKSGHVEGVCRLLRAGKNTVLSESRLSDGAGRPLGVAWVTFTRLPRRADNPTPPRHGPGRSRYQSPEEEPRIPFDRYLGLRFHPEESSFELDHHPRIHNSFGSIQGGAMGSLLARAGTLAGERTFGRPARTTDLHFSYTAQARKGPFLVRAEILRSGREQVLSRVELVDRGQGDRLAAVGTALSCPIGAE
jgi:acyl-coenzyme A thioesterase PaaI-like protein